MDHDCASRQHDAEGEVAVARLVMDGGDLTHALAHLAGALALDPRLPDTHEALAELVARAGGAERALERFDGAQEPDFIGTVAARAHVCATAGRWDEALRLLLAVAAHEPARSWLDVAWLHHADLADAVDPRELAFGIAQLAQRLDDPVDEDRRAPLLPALAVLRTYLARHPDQPTLLWCGSMLARRLGAFDEAIAWADHSMAIEPSHQAGVMKGYALRTAGRHDEALAEWISEIGRAPDDLDLYVDVAELLSGMGRHEEGIEWVNRVLARESRHPRAAPVAHGLRYAIDGDVRHLIALADELRDQPDSDAARVLGYRAGNQPWLGVVAEATESVIDVLRQVLESREPAPDLALSVTVSALEPPSAMLAVRSAFPMMTVDIEAVPAPDLRRAPRPVRQVVWDYDGTSARPAVRPPSPAVAAAIQRVATIHWASPPAAYDRAVELSGADPVELVGCLAHPPAPPDDETGRVLARHAPHLWIRAVQTWACLGIAHHRADEPWAASRRREILASLLDGPEDWVTEAAAFALVVTAWVDPSARSDVHDLVVRRMLDLVEAYRSRVVTILGSMCQLVRILPGLDGRLGALARDVLESLSSD